MPKKFCSTTKGLSPEESVEYATDFKKFTANEKKKFLERRENNQEVEE